MKATGYLIIAPGKYKSEARIVGVRGKSPAMSKNQIAVKIEIELPDNAFSDYAPKVEVKLPPRDPGMIRANAVWNFK